MWDRPDALNRSADLLLAVALLLALYGAFHVVVRLPLFPLREVRVMHPLAYVKPGQIETLIRREVHGNFFTVDIAAVRAAFVKLPWVREASLRRAWPDRLEVTLEEHVPLARWGESGLLNTQGEVFNAAYDGNLPVFAGPPESAKEMAIQYEHFRRSLETIGKVPQQLRVTARRAWQVKLEDGMTLELGREEVEPRLARFIAAYRLTLAPLTRKVEVVDLRYGNGFAVRIPELRHDKGVPKGRRSTSQG
ncbi:MAG TPA: cell division protein FtsQ/DivIB [Burkholderiales bacterium]|nr:cell division protein FtsQ/DivIB [Burkholderiales bacterium]